MFFIKIVPKISCNCLYVISEEDDNLCSLLMSSFVFWISLSTMSVTVDTDMNWNTALLQRAVTLKNVFSRCRLYCSTETSPVTFFYFL